MTFFQLKGTSAINLSPLNVFKYTFLYTLSETFLKPLKILCSSITPYLFMVKQYFILGARNSP